MKQKRFYCIACGGTKHVSIVTGGCWHPQHEINAHIYALKTAHRLDLSKSHPDLVPYLKKLIQESKDKNFWRGKP